MLNARNKAGPLWALGAMSGTSLDGVDAAMVLTDGHIILDFGETRYRAYSTPEQAVLRGALGQWPADLGQEVIPLIQEVHLDAMQELTGADLIGFHGQTLAHDPQGRGTHQAGDGAALAARLGVPVVWDFRSADVQMGGQGAPLAPFFHFACAKWIGAERPLAFLNLGGVGNLTWIDPSRDSAEAPGALLAFDTGPANAPINDLIQSRRGDSFDRDGRLAMQGAIQSDILETFLNDGYFRKVPPKSLDRDAFSTLRGAVADLSDADAAATLTAAAAASVQLAMEHCPSPPDRVLVCGGGRHNPVLMTMLRAVLDAQVDPVEAVGLDGDMLEAQAFGYLAVRVLRGLPTSCPTTTGVAAAICGGQVSWPESAASVRDDVA
ncbi:MAG: anhydro-N-acetylmuramic acid kinase [Pseudomonadota bacterium]